MANMKKRGTTPSKVGTVAEYLQTFAHPLKAEIETVRALILAADPAIQEGIKWNAPSFCVREYFATIHVKNTRAVQIILHLGARPKQTAAFAIDDPAGLLEWLGPDRASIKFSDLAAIQTQQDTFQHIVRQWIAHLNS